jgi:N-acetylglucosamine-6-phosphate deacetylase
MSSYKAITGVEIFDGENRHQNSALILAGGKIINIVEASDIPADCQVTHLNGGLLAPGFIDLQVNGGGGILFNERPDVEAIRTICEAHAQFGTTAMLPTLITDGPEITAKAIKAGIEAVAQNIQGFVGLHLEGPHLSVAKKGAHDPSLIRAMTDYDMRQLLYARENLPNLMTTVAPESVTNEQISVLSKAGIVVSLGHTNATHSLASSAMEAGASCVTHLYNAMSQLTNREPGLVGAALTHGSVYAGLIADGHHIDPAAISIALAAKSGPGQIFLVTDAMSTIGTDDKSFTLNGRLIRRENGRLLLEDGTLAGADLDMTSAIEYMHKVIGLDQCEAIKMASASPARCLGIFEHYGHLKPGAFANIVHLDDQQCADSVWVMGTRVEKQAAS